MTTGGAPGGTPCRASRASRARRTSRARRARRASRACRACRARGARRARRAHRARGAPRRPPRRPVARRGRPRAHRTTGNSPFPARCRVLHCPRPAARRRAAGATRRTARVDACNPNSRSTNAWRISGFRWTSMRSSRCPRRRVTAELGWLGRKHSPGCVAAICGDPSRASSRRRAGRRHVDDRERPVGHRPDWSRFLRRDPA